MNVRDKNRAGKKLYINFKKDPWFQEILTYLYRKYDELAHRMSATFTYVTPDPIVNRSTHSSEFANII